MVGSLDDVIREALDRLERTQQWLAEQVDVTPQAVAKWMKTGQISRENATEVARVLGVSLDALLAGGASDAGAKGQVIDGLPLEEQQQVMDFIRYKYERSEGLLASEKLAHYMSMIDRINSDMAARRTAKPPAPPAAPRKRRRS